MEKLNICMVSLLEVLMKCLYTNFLKTNLHIIHGEDICQIGEKLYIPLFKKAGDMDFFY